MLCPRAYRRESRSRLGIWFRRFIFSLRLPLTLRGLTGGMPGQRAYSTHQKGMTMAGITLSASVRQNLLSLQSTAELLSTTQNRLATGKKVNSALDNPTNFFTAASLDNRASDINNLLDGIGNGVQVLQAANTGISSLQKLVDSAKSVANQALQTTVGYSTKSSVTSDAIAGATANNLLGDITNAVVAGTSQDNSLTVPVD